MSPSSARQKLWRRVACLYPDIEFLLLLSLSEQEAKSLVKAS